MAYFLGVDTGGTYTDAVVLDAVADVVRGKAKALTTRPDLAPGVGAAPGGWTEYVVGRPSCWPGCLLDVCAIVLP